MKTYYLYGKYPALAALANPKRKIHKIFITEKFLNEHKDIFIKLPYEIIDIKLLNKLIPEGPHQGIALKVSPLSSDNFFLNLQPNSKIAILDQITDPHNIGAIIRSAAAFNIKHVIATETHAPEESGPLAKAACGGLEKVNYVKVKNLANLIRDLKKYNFWVMGFDAATDKTIDIKYFEGNVAMVFGSEGKGLRRLTEEHCDFLIKIPIIDESESINVSNAASIAFHYAFTSNLKKVI